MPIKKLHTQEEEIKRKNIRHIFNYKESNFKF
jgi:hypothetical protein